MLSRKPESSAAWILLSLVQATQPKAAASLRDLIAAADLINHSIITRSEVEEGLAVLVPAGLVTCGPDSYSLTQGAVGLYQRSEKPKQSLLEQWPLLTQLLAPLVQQATFPLAPDFEHYASKEQYATAVSTYAVRMPHPLWNTP